MAFHVACPLTCQRICFCALGFPEKLRREKERKDYLEEISRVEEFLKNPWSTGARGRSTVQIPAPRIVVPAAVDGIGGGDGSAVGGDGDEMRSAQTKRAALQRRAVAASIAAEDYVRKYEAGNFVDASGAEVQDLAVEDQGSSALKVMCRICFSGENDGSKRAIRMLPCRLCNKKYHRNCLKSWAAFRDLFHWSSWVCPSCRICEVCRRAGDPNKFMFCKRCDDAYHCYCQQPPHKNITAGPFLCPKHTRCHSCGSTVPGSGFSTRWFLGYTCCDACGRLFVKGKYCPVCLKVYRDSESTPMVCCDVCERWVHCQCDGISDEKYLQFQADRNLHYKCAACRGNCYQVSDLDDAVQELWKRRDEADCDQIASLRAAAGLPFQEEIFSICPYSDDEENDAVTVKSDYGRPFRFYVKGLAEKSTKNTKEYEKKPGKTGKKHVKKKGSHVTLIGDTESPPQSSERQDIQLLENNLGDKMSDAMKTYRTKGPEAQPFIKGRAPKVVKISSSKLHGLELRGGDKKHASKTEVVKGTKLVIHLPSRNRLATNSPKSEISTSPREQDLAVSSGNEDASQQKANNKEKHKLEAHDVTPRLDDGKGAEIDSLKQLKGLKDKGKQSSLIKLGKFKKAEVPELNLEINRGSEEVTTGAVKSALVLSGQKINEGVATVMKPVGEATLKNEEISPKKLLKCTPINLPGENHNTTTSPSSGLVLKDPKPLLKLKFKNHYFESQSSWAAKGEEEKNSVKGQRSKRKRPSPLAEKALFREDENHGNLLRDNPIDEDIDANWILKKLGKDAIGKRVEVHQSSDDTWHKGMVIDMIEGTSSLSVRFDDGRSKTLELGKQGVRFIPQKQKRTKT